MFGRKTTGEIRVEQRERALSLLAAGEKVPPKLQALITDADRRAAALERLVRGEPLNVSDFGRIGTELRARDMADGAAWKGMSLDERRGWIADHAIAAAEEAEAEGRATAAAEGRAYAGPGPRGRALSKLAMGAELEGPDQNYVLDELLALKGANPSEWAAMSPDERVNWLTTQAHLIRAKAGSADQATHGPRSGASVEVVSYKTPSDYEHDAQRRLAEGWTLQGQTQETGQTHRLRRATNGAILGSLFMMPRLGAAIGALSNKRTPGPITATWIKVPLVTGPVPAGRLVDTEGDSGPSSVAGLLRELASLHDAGIITGEEFTAKKAELLSRM